MQKRTLLSLAAAALLAGTGAAYAADTGGNKSSPQAGGAVKNPPGTESPLGTTNLAPIGDWAVGRTVYNRAGEAVGTVRRVEGDKVIVSAGSYLGIGSRDISLAKQHLNQSGSGSDMRLITNLSKAELMQQPEASGSRSGTTGGTGRQLETPANPNTGPSGTR